MAASSWLHGSSALRITEGLALVLKEQRPEFLPEVLTRFREHGVFPAQGASDVAGMVGFTNAKLSASKTRFEGLCMLSVLVKDSSSDLFQQHCLSWLRSLQQVIQSQAPVPTIQLAVNILKDLLLYSRQLPELAREVGLNSILGILTSLLGLKTECELATMEGMMSCMVSYPRACGSLRDKLGAYFISKMDNTNRKTQEMACQCYSRLPCLGGVLDRSSGGGRAESWTYQVHCLLCTANSLLAQIYQGSETDAAVQYQGPGVELSFPRLDQTDPLLVLQLQYRYAAICSVIKHTLRVDPASSVFLPVRSMLNLVCRALAFTSKSVSSSADGSLRLLVLPSVHCSTLEVLSELITTVRSGMVQYAAVIQRLFSQTLSAWTPPPETSMGKQRAYCAVRVAVYRVLELWLQVVGSSANILQGTPANSETLFNQILGDITPGADSVKIRGGLSVDVVPGGKPGPRRTKQLVLSDSAEPSLQRKGDLQPNQDTCVFALRALRQIIQTSGMFLKDDIHKRLHEVVLPLCVRLQQQCSSSSESPANGGGQYGSARTRRELYRLLLALVLVPSPCWPPPLTCAVSILSRGRSDRNLKVSTFCAEALTICNSIVHPRCPSISLPLPALTLKPSPAASVLSSQAPAAQLTLPSLLGPPFPTRHPLNLGPGPMLGSLENHLSLVPGIPGPGPPPGDLILSPHAHHQPDLSGLGPPEGKRPVFVRFDKEEVDDVEISLESDSDDSVVIVPPGMLNAENQPDDPSGQPPGLLPVAPAAEEPVAMVPTAATSGTIDVSSLSDDPAASSPHIPASTTPINSLPSNGSSIVSMVPPLTPGATAPPGGPADPLPVKPQLHQMLMQPPTAGQPPMGLPLHVHPMQNQLPPPARHPRPPVRNEDSAIININSTDEEDEEEDMEEDELDEEGMDEEDEEEEGSEELYDGEEYDDYEDEEGEELEEEEEEEDGEMAPLERADAGSEGGGIEGAKLLRAAVDEGGMRGYIVEGEEEGGIEELETGGAVLVQDRRRVQEVESLGVLEEVRLEGEEESEGMGDPSMPQILCVTGGALEESEEERMERDVEPEEDGSQDVKEQQQQQSPLEEYAASLQEVVAESELEDESRPLSHQEEQSMEGGEEEAGDREEASAAELADVGQEPSTSEKTDAQEAESANVDEEQQKGEAEQEKGIKRKREEEKADEDDEELPEDKQDGETMADMLADFVACPPDDEEVASGSNCS